MFPKVRQDGNRVCYSSVKMQAQVTVLDVFSGIVRDPWHHLVRRWNWKSAVTSGIMRASIFFCANLSAGVAAAFGAMLAEFSYRAILSGASGSVTQALRKAEPPWTAALSAVVVLPACNHTIEFLVHWTRGTPKLAQSVIASITFTVISTLFNLYAMRRGVLVTDDDQPKTLAEDFTHMPRLIAGFLAVGPAAVWRATRRRV
jgi:hypothetical protein